VVFATPGMLHAGQSLQIFRKWAGNEKNMLEVKMQVEYMSFSAHADAKGIMQLIRQAEPRNVLLVHGEAKKMEFLKQKIEQEFRRYPGEGREWQQRSESTAWSPQQGNVLPCFPRATTQPHKAQGIASPWIFLLFFFLPPLQSFRLVCPEQALKELGLAEHQLRFTCRVHIQDPRKEHETGLRVYNHLKGILKDYSVQHLPDGSITVESILIQATAHSEDQGTKVLLV
ncbi:INT11 protein, partial [Panurus biarmicus]|nr:INT11 protein [Panurus biarmicus]